MPALGCQVDHVQVQGGSFVGEVDEVARAGMRARPVEQVDERDPGDHPRATLSTRRDRRLFEICGDREQRIGFARIQLDLLTVLVEQSQRGSHGRNVAVP